MKKIGTTLVLMLVVEMLLISCKQPNPLVGTYWGTGNSIYINGVLQEDDNYYGGDMIYFKTTEDIDVFSCFNGDEFKLESYEYFNTWKYEYNDGIITATEQDGTVQQWEYRGDYIFLFERDGTEVIAKQLTF